MIGYGAMTIERKKKGQKSENYFLLPCGMRQFTQIVTQTLLAIQIP